MKIGISGISNGGIVAPAHDMRLLLSKRQGHKDFLKNI